MGPSTPVKIIKIFTEEMQILPDGNHLKPGVCPASRSDTGLKKMRRSEEKYRRLMEFANDAIFIEDAATGIILEVNRKAGIMLDLSPEKIIGMHQSQLYPPEESERYQNIFREITERKKAEEALRESEARCARAADVAHLGFWGKNVLSGKIFWSRETFRIFGVDPQNFEPTLDNFINLVHPDDRELMQHSLDYMLSNKSKYNTRCRIVRPTGEIKLIHSRGQVKLDERGDIIRITGTVQDIAEHTHIEETHQWAEQLNVVAQLTKGLAEEIKNSLAGIRASIEVLAKEHNFSGEDETIKSNVINEIERVKQTLNSFLSFTRPPKPELMPVNINDVLDMTISFSLKHSYVSYTPPPKIIFVKDFDERVPDIMADPYQLQQIFLNLIFNSFDAMPDGGTITVTTVYISDLNYVQITISDTGKGIDEKVKDKIFQPFCSTKPKGTGLGLAITRRFLDQHGGEICVGSNPGGGTVFYISYPVNNVMDE